MSSEKFDYFIQRTEKDIEEIKNSTDKLHEKVDKLLEFKWSIVGGAALLATFVSIAISLAGVLVLK